jgi:hypothetical protein
MNVRRCCAPCYCLAATLLTTPACFDADLHNFAPKQTTSSGTGSGSTEATAATTGSGGARNLVSGSSTANSASPSVTATTANGGSPSLLLVDDFEDGDTLASNGFGWWYSQNDTAGDQDFRISETSERPPSTRAANSSGIGFDLWGALLGLDLTPGDGMYDASAFAEVRFWAKAAPDSVTSLSARLLEGGELQFETVIELTTEWQEYVLAFDSVVPVDGSDRKVDASRLAAVQFFVFSADRFDFWIDDVVLVGLPEG